jgi:hypothetical protein
MFTAAEYILSHEARMGTFIRAAFADQISWLYHENKQKVPRIQAIFQF